MSFSIIAIKTGEKILEKHTDDKYPLIKWDHLKILEPNKLFKLNNSYIFTNDDFDVIEYTKSTDINIFSIQSHKITIPVSIQAIVGGNGSGKSSLIELIYWANYNLGTILNLFEDNYNVYKELDFQLFYRINSIVHYLLKFTNGQIFLQAYTLIDNRLVKSGKQKKITRKRDLKHFFYTVVVNYSHYSLNEQEVGSWVYPLFHKNDAYQTPLVLNPKREKEGINIVTERKLLSRRLQALTLEPIKDEILVGSLRDLSNGKIAQYFELSYDPEYYLGPYHNLEESKGEIQKILASQIQKIYNFKSINIENLLVEIFLNYILKKLVKMGVQYPNIYGKYIRNNKLKEETDELLEKYLIQIKNSTSHIVFKVKGAILFLKYIDNIFDSKEINLFQMQRVSISKLSNLVSDIKSKEPFFVNTFMLAPPSFFRTDIRLSDNTTIDALSSGERQKIHSISSLLYHIVNLNSVEEQKLEKGGQLISYEYINLILDEIELYYHPDWQRMYINDLIKGIEKLNTDKLSNIKAINVTFLTHSPFILSDIPLNNVLRLKSGAPAPENTGNTFAANIHDLLANDFFLEKGFMGEFAKEKIKGVIDKIEKVKNGEILDGELKKIKSECSQVIDIVGEPMLYWSLMDLYAEAFKDQKDDFINEQIKKLEQLKSKL